MDRGAGVVAVADSPVQSHHCGNGTSDFFGGFFLVRLDATCRVGTDVDVVHHPLRHSVTALLEVEPPK